MNQDFVGAYLSSRRPELSSWWRYTAAMSDESPDLEGLLKACDLLDKAEKVNEVMYQLRWGSAMVIVGTAGHAIVVIAPLFSKMPAGKEAEFCRALLGYNAVMGGMAAFAIQSDGWVVLHAGRGIKGLDAHEFAIMVGTVGKFADDFDDKLHADFYAGTPDAPEAPSAPGSEAAEAS